MTQFKLFITNEIISADTVALGGFEQVENNLEYQHQVDGYRIVKFHHGRVNEPFCQNQKVENCKVSVVIYDDSGNKFATH